MVEFFTSFEWWKTEPHDELVNSGRYCLAKPGEIYAVYLPNGGKVTVKLEPGKYERNWFSRLSGEKIVLPDAKDRHGLLRPAPDRGDWALLLRAKAKRSTRLIEAPRTRGRFARPQTS